MKPILIKSDVPQPIAHYSEAFRVGDFVFAAGKTASDFKTGIAPEARINPAYPYYGSAIKLQTRYILESLSKTFKAAETSLDNVIKAQVFLTDLNNFNGFDEVWKEYFKVPPPRTTLGTTGLLTKDALVEIDLIAYIPRSGLELKPVKSDVPQPIANYSEAFRIGDFVFAAGKTAASTAVPGLPPEVRINPAYPYYGSAIKLQTRYILESLSKTFKAAGTSLDNVIKAQVFLKDLSCFNGFDEVWKEYFKVGPARTTVGTSGLLSKDTLVEIDLIAAVPRPGLQVTAIKSDIPQPLVHYSEAFRVGDFVFGAGKTATSTAVPGVPPKVRINPAYPYYGSAIKLQTRFILETFSKTFKAAGTSLDNVIKAQVFLTDLNNFNGFDEVWKEFFKGPRPPRTTVGTPGLLSADTLVEIDLIAVID